MTHAGFLYSFGDTPDEVKCYFLHLGGPLELKNETELPIKGADGYLKSAGHYIWKPLHFDEEAKNLLRSKCILISQKNKRLPYSIIHDEDTTFDAVGNLKLGGSSFGITCSTFIKIVFKSQNIDIICEDGWPDDRETDEIWAKYLDSFYDKLIVDWKKKIGEIKVQINSTTDINYRNIIGPSCIDRLKEYIEIFSKTQKGIKRDKVNCFKRFRPEEVAAASYCQLSEMPLKFKYDDDRPGAEKLGEDLLALLPDKPKTDNISI